jgi:hypothetical protein
LRKQIIEHGWSIYWLIPARLQCQQHTMLRKHLPFHPIALTCFDQAWS